MDLRRKGYFIFLLIWVLAVAVKAENVVFSVKHKYGGRGGSILKELKAHDSRRHGRMLAAVDFELGGNGQPTDAALYYTKLSIGTPSKDYHVQVDTGSDILWVNCATCARCPSKSSLGIDLKLYDLTASTTGKTVSCDQDFCTDMFNAPYSDCRVGSPCEYQHRPYSFFFLLSSNTTRQTQRHPLFLFAGETHHLSFLFLATGKLHATTIPTPPCHEQPHQTHLPLPRQPPNGPIH